MRNTHDAIRNTEFSTAHGKARGARLEARAKRQSLRGEAEGLDEAISFSDI